VQNIQYDAIWKLIASGSSQLLGLAKPCVTPALELQVQMFQISRRRHVDCVH
jgi:hypothetical protein